MTDPCEWLMSNGGPVVRWRTAVELMGGSAGEDQLAREVISHPVVAQWIERLTFASLPAALDDLDAKSLRLLGNLVHGSKAACLENVYGKLAEFGLRAGMPELDCRPRPTVIFRWKPDWKEDSTFLNAWEALVKSVFAWGLLRLGYPIDGYMQDFLIQHLETCHKIARDQVFDIYASGEELVGLPKAWAGKPIMKQEVMANYWLPYIHDLYVFAYFPDSLRNETTNRMIGELIDYILDPRFQSLKDGYGYAWIKERRTCYGWGWSPHFNKDASPVQRVELLARFERGRQSPVFQDLLGYLDTFALGDDRFLFPTDYLRESEGYYITGAGMGLAEGRKKSTWIEIESTFRMLKIKKLAGQL